MTEQLSPETQLIEQLKKFYSVETLEQLAIQQNRHVERLQERLEAVRPSDSTLLLRPREG